MRNRSHPHALGVGTIILKLTLGKTMQQVLSIKESIVRGSLLCIYGFELVFEQMCCLNLGLLLEKCYECGGSLLLSLFDVCNNAVNLVVNLDE